MRAAGGAGGDAIKDKLIAKRLTVYVGRCQESPEKLLRIAYMKCQDFPTDKHQLL